MTQKSENPGALAGATGGSKVGNGHEPQDNRYIKLAFRAIHFTHFHDLKSGSIEPLARIGGASE
ncbi:hypothetical protein [Marimonas lutisalis]|uniref:hypothetical protein n=1 Tax=Marimonas lutisalis TaxID=2545756 RepID=UPI0010F69994|nr:hypothetical protein [Marimonas lutisalis]